MKRPPGRPPIPEDEKGQSVSTWLPPRDHDKLIKAAKVNEMTVSALMRSWLKLKLRS